MQVNGLVYAPIATATAVKPARRVQPVDAVVRYTPSPAHDERPRTAEAALEGEFLRGAEPGHANGTGTRQALPGTLVNAARAISAYANVSSSAEERKRRHLDLHA